MSFQSLALMNWLLGCAMYQDGLKLGIFLHLLPRCQDCKHVWPCLVFLICLFVQKQSFPRAQASLGIVCYLLSLHFIDY